MASRTMVRRTRLVAGLAIILVFAFCAQSVQAQPAPSPTPSPSPKFSIKGPWKIVEENPVMLEGGVLSVVGAERTDTPVQLIFLSERNREIKFQGSDADGNTLNFVRITTSTNQKQPNIMMSVYEPETALKPTGQLVSILAMVPVDEHGVSTSEPNDASVAARVSKTKADMRSMATALESYYVDNNSYPAWTTNVDDSINGGAAKARPSPAWSLPTFLRGRMLEGTSYPVPMTITTPIAYLTRYFDDPFGSGPGHTFQYVAVRIATQETPPPTPTPDPEGRFTIVLNQKYSNGPMGWLLWSPGPDGRYDINWNRYSPVENQPTPGLLNDIYDPTNGLESRGDIVRWKQ